MFQTAFSSFTCTHTFLWPLNLEIQHQNKRTCGHLSRILYTVRYLECVREQENGKLEADSFDLTESSTDGKKDTQEKTRVEPSKV